MNETSKFWMPCLALAGVVVSSPSHAVLADFVETYDGGAHNVATPVTNTDDDGPPTLVLENDALTASIISSGRASVLVDVTNAAPTVGLTVTQSVDFTVPSTAADTFINNVSRLGFLFGVTAPANSTLGPSDGLYVYLSEPAGDFAPPDVVVDWFDADTGFVNDNGGDPAAGFNPLSGDTTYTMTASATYNGDGSIDVTMDVVGGGGQQVDYSVNIPAVVGEGTLEGSYHGLYFRNFNTDAEIIFDNYAVTVVPEPAAAGLVALAGLVMVRRRRA